MWGQCSTLYKQVRFINVLCICVWSVAQPLQESARSIFVYIKQFLLGAYALFAGGAVVHQACIWHDVQNKFNVETENNSVDQNII